MGFSLGVDVVAAPLRLRLQVLDGLLGRLAVRALQLGESQPRAEVERVERQHLLVLVDGFVDAAQLYQATCAKAGIKIEVKREPGDGYWSTVWNKQPFATSYWGGRSVQDQMYSTAYISAADWNDTRFLNPVFDKMVVAAGGELNQERRKAMYRDMALMVHNEGGVMVPMFNDTIDATGPKVGGWVPNPSAELMGGMAASECWLEA